MQNKSTMKEFAVVTVIGRDKTGVIARITNFLFEEKANIEALEEQVTRGQFSMTLQASWTGGLKNKTTLAAGLDRLAGDLGMEIKVRWTDPRRRQRMAVMVTGEAHGALALLQAVQSGRIKADPAVMLSNRRDLHLLARRFNIPFTFIPWHDRALAEKRALRLL
jgi:formyltetrahydrofolate hydrolase